MRTGALLAIALTAAACGNDDGVTQSPDLAVSLRDQSAPPDLSDSACPATPPANRSPCLGHALCRYATDAGPFVHYLCDGARWGFGNCPWGPYTGATPPEYACTSGCTEFFAEAIITCDCLPTGMSACCIDTGGTPTCYGYGDAGHP